MSFDSILNTIEKISTIFSKLETTILPAKKVEDEDFSALGSGVSLKDPLTLKVLMIGLSKDPQKLSTKIKSDFKKLSESGIDTKDESTSDTLIYKINFSGNQASNSNEIGNPLSIANYSTLNFVFKNGVLLAGNFSKEELLERINSKTNSTQDVLLNGKVKDLVNSFNATTISTSHLDISKIYEKVILLVKGGKNALAQKLPDAQLSGEDIVKKLPYNSPITSFVRTMDFDKNIRNSVKVNFTDEFTKSETFKQLQQLSPESNLSKSINKNQAVFLSVSQQTIMNIVNSVIEAQEKTNPEMTALAKDKIFAYNKYLNAISEVGIGVGAVTAGSMFPSLSFYTVTNDSQALIEETKKSIESGLSADNNSMGGFVSPWQEKNIDNHKVFVKMSPIGVGGFLTKKKLSANKDLVILSSSEDSLKEILNDGNCIQTENCSASATEDKDSSSSSLRTKILENSISTPNEKGEKYIRSNFLFINFSKIASIFQSVQGTLSLFTGGKQGVPPSIIETLSKTGSIFSEFNIDNNSINVNLNFFEPEIVLAKAQ